MTKNKFIEIVDKSLEALMNRVGNDIEFGGCYTLAEEIIDAINEYYESKEN